MMQWIILLVIAFFAFLFFRSQRQTHDREVVLPKQEDDMEAQGELHPELDVDLDQINTKKFEDQTTKWDMSKEIPDEEYAGESYLHKHFVAQDRQNEITKDGSLSPKVNIDTMTGELAEKLIYGPPLGLDDIANIAYTDAAYSEGEYGEEITPVTRDVKTMIKIPLHYGKACSHLSHTKQTNRKKETVWRKKEYIGMTGMNEKITSSDHNTMIPKISSQTRIVFIEPTEPADHTYQIGILPKRPSGHEISIHMDLQPTLTALSKDPYWVFLYWVLPPNTPEGFWELKVKNLSQQVEYFQRIDPGAKGWYLHLNQPDQKFVFELGVRNKAGHFFTVLMSNEILTPRDRPSSVVDVDWLTIEEFYRKKMIFNPQGSPSFILEFGGKIGASEQLVH